MNIAIASEFFSPFVTGGAEIFLGELAGALKSSGHKVVVITTEQGQGSGKFRAYKLKTSPFRHSHRQQFHGITVPWMFGNQPLIKKIERIYKKESIDVVYANNIFHLSFAPIQAAKSLDIPVLLDVHDYWPICFSKDMLHRSDPYKPCAGEQGLLKCSKCIARKMGLPASMPFLIPGLLAEKRLRKKWLALGVDKVVCHSVEGVEELKRHGIRSISVPYPYLGPPGWHEDSGDGIFRMLFVSRLEKVRGAHLLIPIAKRLVAEKVVFRIDVIGKGSLMKSLDRKDLNIYVHGFMGDERFDYFKRADCLLALQRYPVPFGINVLEGMAFQIPAIGFRECGPGCLIRENSAGIPCGMSEKSLFKAVEKIRKNRRFAKNVMENDKSNIKKYSRNLIFREYQEIFLSMVRPWKQ